MYGGRGRGRDREEMKKRRTASRYMERYEKVRGAVMGNRKGWIARLANQDLIDQLASWR